MEAHYFQEFCDIEKHNIYIHNFDKIKTLIEWYVPEDIITEIGFKMFEYCVLGYDSKLGYDLEQKYLVKIARFVKHLSISDGYPPVITPKTIDGQLFYNLKSLKIKAFPIATDILLINLANLENLYVEDLGSLTDDYLNQMKNLKMLNIQGYNKITDQSIQNLTTLIELILPQTRFANVKHDTITNSGIKDLTNLTKLKIMGNQLITDDAITKLTNLTELDIRNTNITKQAIVNLPLTKLQHSW